MLRRTFGLGLAATPLAYLLRNTGLPGTSEVTANAKVTVDLKREIGRIDPKIHGHFIEHVDRVVYGGIYDDSSPLSDSIGIRQDVVKAILEMGGAHVLRWPGGNFASYYDWQDGIGPRDKRPTRFDVVWRNFESNRFGTDEYLALCRQLDCNPFITVNMGDGTLREACEWVEYTRLDKREPPVVIWGLGNENYGSWQVGYYTAQEYGRKAQQFGQFMRAVAPDIKLLAVGSKDPEWNASVLQECGAKIDWLTIHLYSHRYFLDGVDDFDSSVAAPVFFENEIKSMIDQIAVAETKLNRNAPIEVCLEEWNGRHFKKGTGPVTDPGLLRDSPRNIVDALFVAGVFNMCQRLSTRLTMTNYVFLLNAHAPIVVYPNGVLKSVLFDVFRFYSTLTLPVAVVVNVECESFHAEVQHAGPTAPVTAGRIDAAASRTIDGRKMTLALINRYRDRSCRVALDFPHQRLSATARWHILQSKDLFAVNSRQHPDLVHAESKSWETATNSIELGPASVNFLELEAE